MIEIRALQPCDVDQLIALGELAVQETRYQNQRYDPVKVRAQFEAYFKDERRKYVWLIALKDDLVQGFLFGCVEEYWFTESLGANMIVWYVSKAARGSSMAIKLLMAFKRWAENRKVNEITLSITSGLRADKTSRFLKRMGFVSCGENFHLQLSNTLSQ